MPLCNALFGLTTLVLLLQENLDFNNIFKVCHFKAWRSWYNHSKLVFSFLENKQQVFVDVYDKLLPTPTLPSDTKFTSQNKAAFAAFWNFLVEKTVYGGRIVTDHGKKIDWKSHHGYSIFVYPKIVYQHFRSNREYSVLCHKPSTSVRMQRRQM